VLVVAASDADVGQLADLESGKLGAHAVAPRRQVLEHGHSLVRRLCLRNRRGLRGRLQSDERTVTDEQVQALSDDPDEMTRQLNDIAGSGAIIRVDSFEGQQMPPKSQIKSIHVTRDQFAAETEQPGSTFVDRKIDMGFNIAF
jgi:hypothetical protein